MLKKKIKELNEDEKIEGQEGEEKDEQENTEEENEAEQKMLKAIKDSIDKKADEIFADIKATEKRALRPTLGKYPEKTILNSDPVLRKRAPFVELSKKMTDFVNDAKVLAKGGMPVSLQKALAEGTDSDGGFLVPEEFQAEVFRYATEASIVRPRARVFNMTRDTLGIPKLDQSSDQFAGVALYWAAESGLKTASQPSFGKITLSVKKLIGLCPVADELLEDSAINLANFLVSLFGEAIAYEEDKKFIQGTGMGQPLGIINGMTIVARNTSSTILATDIYKMWTELPVWAEDGAVWLTSKNGIAQLLRANQKETNTFNFFLSNLSQAIPYSLLGKPVLVTDKVETTIGTKGDIILANLNYYFIGDRSALQVTSSIHDRFRYDETVFRFVKRVDGQPATAKAFVGLNP